MRRGEQIPAWGQPRKNGADDDSLRPPPPAQPPGALRMIGRALLLRCPSCGRGRLFSGWLTMRTHCPECGMRLNRGESDYFIGAYTINLIVAEMIVVAVLVVVMLATWPAVPWDKMKWGIIALTLSAPFVTYPFSKSLWLALDLIFRPATLHDFNDDSSGDDA
jgi:uncharacterized protein (DUF983 family)